MKQMIDFTSCPRVLGRAYNGANGKKIAVLYICLQNEDEMNARIYSFPSSMHKIGGRKICYHDFICGEHPAGLDLQLSNLLPKIQALDFKSLIASTPFLSQLQQDFYLEYLTQRREKIFH